MNQPLPPQSWPPQHQRPSGSAAKKKEVRKWMLGAVALLAVALVAVIGVTTLVVGGTSDEGLGNSAEAGGTGADSGTAADEYASAHDVGPVAVITADPTCAWWTDIDEKLSKGLNNGWAERDPSLPAMVWSPEWRKVHVDAGEAMRSAADETAPLMKLTPHRVVRELYDQFIAYAREYEDSVLTYTESDDALAQAATQAAGVLSNICEAMASGSASARASLVPEGAAPASVAPIPEPTDEIIPTDPRPEMFLTSPDPVCRDWAAAVDRFDGDTSDWRRGMNVNLPVDQWPPEQKSLADAVVPVMRDSADTLEELGRRSDSPVFADFAQLAAQYRRAFAEALPTYSAADRYLYEVGVLPAGMVRAACDAAGAG